MKKILLGLFIFACSSRAMANEPTVNEKVLTAFRQAFQHASDVSWYEYTQSYEVCFKQDEIMTRITYDKKGNIVRTLRYYNERSLPIMVLARVKNRFPEKKIYGVVEECSYEGTIYHITLEDATHWLGIKADNDGFLSVENKFKKA